MPTSDGLGRPARPDPRPMRVVYGAGALVAVGALSVSLSRPAPPAEIAYLDNASAGTAAGSVADLPAAPAQPSAAPPSIAVRHVVQYVQLQPGQTAPPGATVIQPGAPTPRVVVTYVKAPKPVAAQPRAQAPKPAPTPQPTAKTRQSGKK